MRMVLYPLESGSSPIMSMEITCQCWLETLLGISFPTFCIGVVQVHCRRDKNSVSSPPLEPCFDVPNNSPNHLLNSLFLCLEKLAKKSSNQTTHIFSCQISLLDFCPNLSVNIEFNRANAYTS